MKLAYRLAAVGILLSILTVGFASAMIPKDSLKTNLFPDIGISSQVLSDIDNGKFIVGTDDPEFTESNDKSVPLTQSYQQLRGKHLI